MTKFDFSRFIGFGATFAKEAPTAMQDFAMALIECGAYCPPEEGTGNYEAYVQARDEFMAGAKAEGYAAPDILWHRRIKYARALALIGADPKSPKKEAVKKSEQREAKANAVKAALEEVKTVQDATAKAAEAAKAGDLKKAAVFTSAALELDKQAQAAAKGAAKDKVKLAKAALKEAEGKMDAAQLESLAAVAQAILNGKKISIR